MKFMVIVTPGMDGDGYVVECPTIHGCVSQGTTIDEALENIKDAIHGCAASLMDDGIPLMSQEAVQFFHVEVPI